MESEQPLTGQVRTPHPTKSHDTSVASGINLYEYTALRNATNMRLLHLNNNSAASGDLYGALHEYDQTDAPQYECLSYVWGTGEKNAKIYIGEFLAAVSITESLHRALLSLQESVKERILWIDQICINQDDVTERNEQVQQMGRIYEGAERDIVWLGESNEDGDRVVTRLVAMLDAWDAFILSNPPGRSCEAAKIAWQLYEPYDGSHTDWIELDSIFRLNPVWNRVWIVQEVLLAKNVILRYGNTDVNLDLFHRFLQTTQIEGSLPRLTELESHLQQLWYNRTRQKTNRRSLEGLLFDYWGLEATDPRDKVYALLGIARWIKLTVDYSKTMAQVQVETTKAMMEQSGTLNLLCFDRCNVQGSSSDPGLPSWVFDYRGLTTSELWTLANSDFDGFGSYGGFFAGGIDPSSEMSFGVVAERLEASGLCIDTLADVQEAFHLSEDQEDGPRWSHVWHRRLLEDVKDMAWKISRATGHSPQDRDWTDVSRLLVHDQIATEDRMDEEQILENFDQFKQWASAISNDHLEIFLKRQHKIGTEFFYGLEATWGRGTRRLARTAKHNLLVTIGTDAQVGDEICVLRAASVPLLLRKSNNGSYMEMYKQIGTAYVHGIMDGEAWERPDLYPAKFYRVV